MKGSQNIYESLDNYEILWASSFLILINKKMMVNFCRRSRAVYKELKFTSFFLCRSKFDMFQCQFPQRNKQSPAYSLCSHQNWASYAADRCFLYFCKCYLQPISFWSYSLPPRLRSSFRRCYYCNGGDDYDENDVYLSNLSLFVLFFQINQKCKI